MLWLTKSRNWSCLAIPALVILATLWLFPLPGFAGTYTIYPMADATVDSNTPDGSFGLDVNVAVGSDAWGAVLDYGYFKFDLSSIIPTGERVTGCTLNAYCNYATAIRPYCELRAVADTGWIESGIGAITWDKKPALGATVIATTRAPYLPPGTEGSWTQWNIPGPNLAATGLVSFVLTPRYYNASTYQASFTSKDSTDSSHRPYLQVTTTKFAGAGVDLLLSPE